MTPKWKCKSNGQIQMICGMLMALMHMFFNYVYTCLNCWRCVPIGSSIYSNTFQSSTCRSPTLCSHTISPFRTCWLKHRSCYISLVFLHLTIVDPAGRTPALLCTILHHAAAISCIQLLITPRPIPIKSHQYPNIFQ